MSILTNAFKFCIATILITSFAFKAWSVDFDSLHPGSAENLIADTEYLSQMAILLLEDVENRVAERPPLESLNEMKKKIRQAAYLVARTSSLSESFLKTSLIDYPDVIKVNIGLQIASTLMTPVLIFMGYPGWAAMIHIPGFEETLTGAYFLTRRWLQKKADLKRFGVPTESIERYKFEIFTPEEVKSINLHTITEGLEKFLVPVARKKMTKAGESSVSADLITLRELETLIGSADFLHEARKLNLDPSLYEELLIQKILSEPSLKEFFLMRVKTLSRHRNDQWSNWTLETEDFLNRIRSEAMLQGFEKQRLLGKGREQYIKVFWAAKKDRKVLYGQIRDLELYQFEILASILRGENPNYQEANIGFQELRKELLDGFSHYKEKYPSILHSAKLQEFIPVVNSCKDLFAAAI